VNSRSITQEGLLRVGEDGIMRDAAAVRRINRAAEHFG
jgi:hypothetical protein